MSPGQSVTLLNNAGDPLELNANGNFQFSMPIAYGGSYQVTVSAATPGLICSEVADSDFGSDIQGKVNSVQIICSTQTFTIGGSIGIRNTRSVTLFNNGGDLLTLNRSGNFQFATPVAYGAGYRIQITTGVRNTVCYVATASQSRAIGTVTSNINDIMAGCGPWGGSMVPTNGLTFLVLVGSGPFISQWSLADAVCSSQVGGYRLPTLAELQAINGLPLTNLKAVYTSPVWTATAENSGSHDTFSLSTGMVSTPGDQSGQYALCVR